MIQRIQTLYFILITAGLITIFLMPLATFTAAEGTITSLFATHHDTAGNSINAANAGFPFVLGVCILLAASSVFLYKNRIVQIRVARFNFLFIALAMALLSLYISNVFDATGGRVVLEPAFFLLIPILFFNWLAMRAIKRDEDLVRSLDRIR